MALSESLTDPTKSPSGGTAKKNFLKIHKQLEAIHTALVDAPDNLPDVRNSF
jgi:hypothetical protein